MTYKHPVSVLVVIHTPTLEILLLERAAHPGYWQSVTGSQEEGETLEETARRELFEETGIRVEAAQIERWPLANRFEILPLWRHRYAPGVTHNLEHVFSVCVPQGAEVTIAPGEHRAFRWLPWREAAAECFSWTNQDAVLMLPLRVARAA
ncbi:MAG: dihydroneopterin triphosphate diphosphatase [Rhodocyclaceae bacterium]